MTSSAATRAIAIAVTVILGAAFVGLPRVRRSVIAQLVTDDAPPGDPPSLPRTTGAPLPPAPRTRVIVVDGLSAEVARTLPGWSATCARGVTLTVDVGFPTVSLPVEVALWTGLTQQQTGIVYRADRPIAPPPASSIAAKRAGSRAIAEDHPYIIRSLGFATTLPAQGNGDEAAWRAAFPATAVREVAGDAALVFVHVLRVDTAGHRYGGASAEYRAAAASADALVQQLIAAAPDARWFLLSDHGHLPGGGHGGAELSVRQVQACIAGPGVAVASGGPVHVVDVARALADSVGVTLDREARGRPLGAALAVPLEGDQAVPRLPIVRGALAVALLVIGVVLTIWTSRRGWLAPWWFAIACASLVVVRGAPTLSTPMMYAPSGQLMWLTWLPALAVCTGVAWIGMRRVGVVHAAIAQLALPVLATAAAITAAGMWPAIAGEHVAAAAPHYTAWATVLLLMTAHGAAAVALAALATAVRPASGRPLRPEIARSAPAAD